MQLPCSYHASFSGCDESKVGADLLVNPCGILIAHSQDLNLLIGRKMHNLHHHSPFENNYCIVSGWWNPLLDSTGFFRGLEHFFFRCTGVAPRCWDEDASAAAAPVS